jgi:hypothetical protein
MLGLANLVEKKRVAVVGNAMSILDRQDGEAIDAHDVVIRINMGLPRDGHDPVSIGKRTDVWATARFFGPPPPDAMLTVWMKITISGLHERSMFIQKHPMEPLDLWTPGLEELCREFVGADPGTGIRLVWWLKHYARPDSVSVYGMDCWKSVSHWSKRANTPNHKPSLERLALDRLLA